MKEYKPTPMYGLFPCEYTNVCIPDNLKCDGRPDCTDSFDERNCRALSSLLI